jgi:hypothetical protein
LIILILAALLAAALNGAADNLFSADPFSRYGWEMMAKAYPAAVDLAAAKGNAKLHADTVPSLQFAAPRMDYLGMKIQFSREIANCYRADCAASAVWTA